MFVQCIRLHHFLVSASADRALRVWDALEGRMVLEIKTNHRKGESIVSLSCRKDNRFIATGDSGGWLKVWHQSAHCCPLLLPTHTSLLLPVLLLCNIMATYQAAS